MVRLSAGESVWARAVSSIAIGSRPRSTTTGWRRLSAVVVHDAVAKGRARVARLVHRRRGPGPVRIRIVDADGGTFSGPWSRLFSEGACAKAVSGRSEPPRRLPGDSRDGFGDQPSLIGLRPPSSDSTIELASAEMIAVSASDLGGSNPPLLALCLLLLLVLVRCRGQGVGRRTYSSWLGEDSGWRQRRPSL